MYPFAREILKYVLLCLLALMIYIAHKMIIAPYLVRLRYKKYPNVDMADKFYPGLGDVAIFNKNKREGKYAFSHLKYKAMKNHDKDILILQLGPDTFFNPISIQALKEIYALVPYQIDRGIELHKHLAKINTQGIGSAPTSPDWKTRRDSFTQLIEMNFASQYIPIFIDAVKEHSQGWLNQQEVDVFKASKSLGFSIVSRMIFGVDIEDTITSIDYKHKDGTISKLSVSDHFIKVTLDTFESYLNPKGIIFNFINTYNLLEPFKTDDVNVKAFQKAIDEYLRNSKDQQSIYKRMVMQGVSHEDSMTNVLSLLLGNASTTSHVITSILYFLKKFPHTLAKLEAELAANKLDQLHTMGIDEAKKKIDECDYLSYCIKEILRIDTSSQFAIDYRTFSDVNICGVPIEKNSKLYLPLFYRSYDTSQWHNPMEFMPERFSPDSKFFFTPESNFTKPRSPFAFIPFSMGLRNCPGQSLAKLVLKVVTAFIVTNFDYEIPKELLKNDDVSFASLTHFELKTKFTQKLV